MKKEIALSFLMLAFVVLGCKGNSAVDEPFDYDEVVADESVVEEEADPENEGEVVYLTTAEFKKLIFDYSTSSEWKYKGKLPCIIDFYATWCGPCRMIAPYLSKIAKEYEGKILVYKVDVDKERELASYFAVRSIPMVLFVPKKGRPQSVVGAQSKEAYEEVIEEVFKIKK